MTDLTRYVFHFADSRQFHAFEERAAIHEFDGKASRDEAERLAFLEVFPGIQLP